MTWSRQLQETAHRYTNDISHLLAALRGRRPSPVRIFSQPQREPARPSAQAPRATPAEQLAARTVRVVSRTEETADVTTLTLRPTDGGPRVRLAPGQFVTVVTRRGGEVVRRCYSLSGTPADGEGLSITVKATPGGQLSPWLQGEVAVDDVLQIEPPAGRFGVAPSPDARRDVVLIGGGSGVTPLFSVLRHVLETERSSRVVLLDGNRSPADIIFRDRLVALQEAHPDRLSVHHVVEDGGEGWSARTGRLDAETLSALLDEATRDLVEPVHLVCGPAPMMAGAVEVLAGRGVAPERIVVEHYDRPDAGALGETAGSATIRVDGAELSVVVPPGGSLLEAGRAAGLPMPSSCTVGGCAACKVRVVSGEVQMAEPNCLTASEVEDGWALACVARPVGSAVVEVPERGA